MVFDQLSMMVDSMDVHETKLGLWSWVKLVGKEGHTTRVITAYQPFRAGKQFFNWHTFNIIDNTINKERRSDRVNCLGGISLLK